MDTSHINLITLIDTELKRRASTNGGEYAGPCPFCGGTDRFRVWPTPRDGNPRFWCRQCRVMGDAINYVMLRDHVEFQEAVHLLGLSGEEPFSQGKRATKPENTKRRLVSEPKEWQALTSPDWQQGAQHFANWAFDMLRGDEAEDARHYLYDRGLTGPVITAAGLGYNPHPHKERWGGVEVTLHAGIVIPWEYRQCIWKINIRRLPSMMKSSGDSRYMQISGGANGLFRAGSIFPGCTALVTEGEFDALCLQSRAIRTLIKWNIVPVATGSASGAHLMQWVVALAKADRVLLAFDADQAGDEAGVYWSKLFGDKAVRLRPTQHDITDMWKAGENLEDWIVNAVNPHVATI